MGVARWAAVAAVSFAMFGCDESTGLEVVDLEGVWSATVFEYTDNVDSANVVDLIERDGAVFTLTVDSVGTASTEFDDGTGGTSTDSGTLNAEGTMLTLTGTTFEADQNGGTLTLLDEDSEFDFGDGTMSPATLRIVMARN